MKAWMFPCHRLMLVPDSFEVPVTENQTADWIVRKGDRFTPICSDCDGCPKRNLGISTKEGALLETCTAVLATEIIDATGATINGKLPEKDEVEVIQQAGDGA